MEEIEVAPYARPELAEAARQYATFYIGGLGDAAVAAARVECVELPDGYFGLDPAVLGRVSRVMAAAAEHFPGKSVIPVMPSSRAAEVAEGPRRLSFFNGDLVIDPDRWCVMVAGEKAVGMTPRMWSLLHYLACEPGKGRTYREIGMKCWGYYDPDVDNGIRVYIHRTRRLLGEKYGGEKGVIETLPGGRYCFNDTA